MSSFSLKLFAAAFMLVDHLGILLNRHRLIDAQVYLLMRTLGRFAFPVYAFLLAEGFRQLKHSPERLKRHAFLLLLLTVTGELAFDWFDHRTLSYSYSQSVMFTLLLGFLGLWLAELWRDRPWRRLGIFLLTGAAGYMIEANYRLAGVLLIFACSLYLDRFEAWDYARRCLGVLGVMGCYLLVYAWSGTEFGSPAAAWDRLRGMGWFLLPHLLLVPLLASYQGRLGYRSRVLHRCYQWFYPAHLAALGLISALLG